VASALRHVADNDVERNHKRILEIIRKAGPAGIRLNDLTRKVQFVEPKLRRDILLTLAESEQVVATPTRNRGRPGVLYKVSEVAQGVSSNVKDSSIDVTRDLKP